MNELFDRVAAALFEQSVLKAELKKSPTVVLTSPNSKGSATSTNIYKASSADLGFSDRYLGMCVFASFPPVKLLH